jgi:hypothetical protein
MQAKGCGPIRRKEFREWKVKGWAMTIRKGDRLIMAIDGLEVPVEAASDELNGLVVVKHRETFCQCPTESLRPDTEPGEECLNFVQITGKQPDPAENSTRCPYCGELGQFQPPNRADSLRRVLITQFRCPQSHEWTQEFPLK